MQTEQKLILLDFGHGGLNPKTNKYTTDSKIGKNWQHKGLNLHTPDGWFFEGVFNRQIGTELCQLLQKANIAFEVLSHEWQDNSLTERIARANKKATKVACLVSIHANAAPNPKTDQSPNGFSVFVGRNASPKSKHFAALLAKDLESVLPDFRHRRQSPTYAYWQSPSKIAILEDTKCPAILSENGFYTNPNEAKRLLEPENIAKIAEAHFSTIQKILENNLK